MNAMTARQGRCDGAAAIGRLIEPPAGFEDPAIAISEQRAVMIAYGSGTKGPADHRIHVSSGAAIPTVCNT